MSRGHLSEGKVSKGEPVQDSFISQASLCRQIKVHVDCYDMINIDELFITHLQNLTLICLSVCYSFTVYICCPIYKRSASSLCTSATEPLIIDVDYEINCMWSDFIDSKLMLKWLHCITAYRQTLSSNGVY